jgi:hypothetical protein
LTLKNSCETCGAEYHQGVCPYDTVLKTLMSKTSGIRSKGKALSLKIDNVEITNKRKSVLKSSGPPSKKPSKK